MDKYPTRATHTAWRVIDNEVVIVSPMESEITTLNEVGTSIWKLIDGKRGIGEIAKGLCEEFDVSEEDAIRDIQEFIRDLEDKKLVVSKG